MISIYSATDRSELFKNYIQKSVVSYQNSEYNFLALNFIINNSGDVLKMKTSSN